MATLDNQPWYCKNDTMLASLLGCDNYLPTAADQAQMMRENFGGSSDPGLVDASVGSFADWLKVTGYDKTMEGLKNPNSVSNWLVTGLLAVGVVGLVITLGDSGPRRYGR